VTDTRPNILTKPYTNLTDMTDINFGTVFILYEVNFFRIRHQDHLFFICIAGSLINRQDSKTSFF